MCSGASSVAGHGVEGRPGRSAKNSKPARPWDKFENLSEKNDCLGRATHQPQGMTNSGAESSCGQSHPHPLMPCQQTRGGPGLADKGWPWLGPAPWDKLENLSEKNDCLGRATHQPQGMTNSGAESSCGQSHPHPLMPCQQTRGGPGLADKGWPWLGPARGISWKTCPRKTIGQRGRAAIGRTTHQPQGMANC
jgi:hypothetical protein